MSKSKKIIGMGLGLAVLVSSMGLAFAVNGQSKETDTAKSKYQRVEQFKEKGIGIKVNLLDNLVKAGTITQDQLKAIQESMKQTKDSLNTQKTMKERLDSLVTAGTITQAQEDAVIKEYDTAKALMQAEQEERLGEIAKEKGITVDELKAQMEERKAEIGQRGHSDFKGIVEKVNVLDGLVTAGTITADQQKAIQETLKPTKDSQKTQKTVKERLDSLVTAGTITQEQEAAVIKAYDAAKELMQAEQEKRLVEMAAKKGITVDELKAQIEKQKTEIGKVGGDFKGKIKFGRTEK